MASDLVKTLRNSGLDLIDGVVREHKPLSIWIKRNTERVSYRGQLDEIFSSPVPIRMDEFKLPDIDFDSKACYNMNIGASAFSGFLATLGISDLSTVVKGGKKMEVSFSETVLIKANQNDVQVFFESPQLDFHCKSNEIYEQANLDNLILVTGVAFAKKVDVSVSSDFSIDTNVKSDVKNLATVDVDAKFENEKTLKMIFSPDELIPVAVLAYRLRFNRGFFEKMNQVSDNRDFF
jgi:hypothetical protein